jgi:hypothetical protein
VYSNSRNINDKIYRSGTEELALYKVGPQTIRDNYVNGNEQRYHMYNKTQGFDARQVGNYMRPRSIRKKSMHEKISKNNLARKKQRNS